MIIGNDYVFVQNPRCASSQMGRELERYGGEHILRKHSPLSDLPICYRPRFTFMFVRNPLDKLVTLYLRGRLTKQIGMTNGNFAEFCEKLLETSIDHSLSIKHIDFVGRYENINNDWSTALTLAGISQDRELPWEYRTPKKEHFLDFYDSHSKPLAEKYCGAQMELLGYSFPEDW